MILKITQQELEKEIVLFMQSIRFKYTDESLLLNPADVISMICEKLSISTDELKSLCRDRNITMARHISAYILYEKFSNLTLREIGFHIGLSHHTTVLYSLKKIKAKLVKSDKLNTIVNDIFTEIDNARKI